MFTVISPSRSSQKKSYRQLWIPPSLFLGLILVLIFGIGMLGVKAQQEDGYWYAVQRLEAVDLGVTRVGGIAALPDQQTLLIVDTATVPESVRLELISQYGDPLGSYDLPVPGAQTSMIAYSAGTGDLFMLDSAGQQMLEIQGGGDAGLPPGQRKVKEHATSQYGIKDPQGMSIDSTTGRMFILDAEGPEIIVLPADKGGGFGAGGTTVDQRVERIHLKALRGSSLKGLAYNPETDLLYMFSISEDKIYGLNLDGKIETTLNLVDLGLHNLQGMVFTNSTDPTDDPQQMNLFLADSGATDIPSTSSVIELSLNAVVPLAVPPGAKPTTLVHVIDTSIWSPPSPDVSGVVYLSSQNQLFTVDSEVEEMSIWQGKNTFTATLSGTLISSCSTTYFSDEPTGVSVNPTDGHLFISDDNTRKVYEINLGPDGAYCTADDSVTSFSTTDFGDGDPEDVAYGAGRLYVTDGVGTEVYVIDPGPNGRFDGVNAPGDDVLITHFDTSVMGLRDPEGIGYHWVNGTLFIISISDKFTAEVTTEGVVLNYYDFTSSNIVAPAGVTIAPGSVDSTVLNMYISQRGVDNGVDPNENDGKVYEINFSGAGYPTFTPTNTAGPPTPTNTTGPSPTPTNTPPGFGTISLQVSASTDDAEEEVATGIVDVNSSDLELGADGTVLQWVGMRFNNIAVPEGANILNAYIEFEVDETGKAATSVLFYGQAADNPATFTTATYNISSRPRTVASVPWNNIPSWTVVDAKWQSPDLSTVINEIVSRSGWAYGNSIVILVDGTGRRTAEAYDGEPPAAAKLVISYYTGSPATETAIGTDTPVIPTATDTPTPTPITPTVTDTSTPTPITPSPTHTLGPSPTASDTPIPPTATDTPLPPTVTNTPLPPTSTYTPTLPPTATSTPTPTPTPLPYPITLSLQNTGPTTVGTLTGIAGDDIIRYDGSSWSMLFDASDVGLAGNVAAFAVLDNSNILLTLTRTVSVTGVGKVYPQDVLKFTGTLGPDTTGVFTLYFDGSDVGMEKAQEAIKGIYSLPNGNLIISTKGAIAVPGLTATADDMLLFTQSAYGATTSGTWSLFFSGLSVGLTGTNRVDAFAVDSLAGDLYLSTGGLFTFGSVTADNEDVFVCTPQTTNPVTACSFSPDLYFDGSLWNLAADNVDGISVP